MASLQARSPLRSAHPLFFINKIISLIAFIVLLGAGWVALCYLKTELTARWRGGSGSGQSVAASTGGANASAASQNNAVSVKADSAARLVYSCAGDDKYYHTATHLPARCERFALGEEAAFQRGLKPCLVCIAK